MVFEIQIAPYVPKEHFEEAVLEVTQQMSLRDNRFLRLFLNRIVAVQVSDTTGDDSSNVAGYIILTFTFKTINS
jgi:hypothetical protein